MLENALHKKFLKYVCFLSFDIMEKTDRNCLFFNIVNINSFF